MDSLTTYRPKPTLTCTKALALYLGLLVGFTAFYAATAQRGVSWQDSGMFQYRAVHGDYSGELGLALAHPMYILMLRAVVGVATWWNNPHPIAGLESAASDDAIWAMNAFSGLGMAIALANLFLLVTRLTGRWWAGVGIALMMSVAHTNWWMATIAEEHSWSLVGLSLECLLLVSLIRRPEWSTLAWLALVSGWGWSVHNAALLPLPVHLTVMVYLMVRRRLPVWSVVPAMTMYALGAALYIGMIIYYAMDAGLSAAVKSALFGNDFQRHVLGGGARTYLPYNLALMSLNGVSLLPVLAVVGWWHFRRRLGGQTALALAAITVIHAVFVLRYFVPDQFTFFLPTLWLTAMAGGVGLVVLVERSRRWRKAMLVGMALSLVTGPAAYALLPHLVRTPDFRRALPFRDEIRYWAVPWKHNERSAEQFAQAVLDQLGNTIWDQRGRKDNPVSRDEHTTVLLDSTSFYPVILTLDQGFLREYVQVLPLPLDKFHIASVHHAVGVRPVYILSPRDIPPSMRDEVTPVKTHPDNVLYRLVVKQDPEIPHDFPTQK